MTIERNLPVLPAKQAILFDLDGVLIDSEPIHGLSLSELSERFGGRYTTEKVLSFKGLPERSVGEIILRDFPHLLLSTEEISQMRRAIVKDHFHEIELIEGALAFVQKAKAAGYRLGVTTSAPPDLQTMAFQKFDLGRYFDATITGADVVKGKPDPEPYLKTAEKVGCPAAGCFIIEDAVNGVVAGKAAGAYVIGLATTFAPESLRQAGADWVAASFAQIAAALPEPKS